MARPLRSWLNVLRLLGLAVLTALVAAPFAYFYDAILLVLPTIVLWIRPDLYRSPGLRLGAMGASLSTWIWMHLHFFILHEVSPSLVGVGLGVWLVLELRDFWRPHLRSLPLKEISDGCQVRPG